MMTKMVTNGCSGLGAHRVRAAVVGLVLPLVACMSAAGAHGDGGGPSCWNARERIEYLFGLGLPVKIAREVLEELLFGEGPGGQGHGGGGSGQDKAGKDDGQGGKTGTKKKKISKKKSSGDTKPTTKDGDGKDDTKEGDTKAL